jgi:hypothetical protein
LSTPEPEPRDSDPVWQPPEWLTPPKRYPSTLESPELPSWSPPPLASSSPAPKPTWAPPSAVQAPPQAPMAAAVAWTPPAAQPPSRPAEAALSAQPVRPSAVAPSEDEYVDGGFASEFDDDEFDDGPGSDDEFPPLDLAAASGRHRKRRRRLDQPAIEIPIQPTASAAARGVQPSQAIQPALPPMDALGDDDDFADEGTSGMSDVVGEGKPAPAAKSERPKAKQPRDDDDDDDFDDDEDDDDDFGDDDDEDDPAANSSSQLGASVTAPKDPSGRRKLPWMPITAVAGGLVLVLAFAFRETLFGIGDDGEVADSAAETGTDGAEPAAEPEPEPKPEVEPQPEPEPEPKPPAIPTEELDAKIAEATSLVNRQKFDDARVILDEVLGKIPNEGRALALLAQTHLEKNKLEDALATANDCVAADAKQAFCWIVIATVEQANDNLPRALEAYRKYLEVEPTGQHAKSAKKQITRLEGKGL